MGAKGKAAPKKAAEGPAEPTGDPSAKHKEFVVAKVKSCEEMKKKKGSTLVEVESGADTNTVITSYDNLEEGQLVIFAPEGSAVGGKPVKRAKVAGEWNEGVICGPTEMGWAGDASKAIILDPAHEANIGGKAPMHSAGATAAGVGGGSAGKKGAPAKKKESESDDEPPQAAARGKK